MSVKMYIGMFSKPSLSFTHATLLLIFTILLVSSLALVFAKSTSVPSRSTWDVIIYGGTPAAITAALQVKRMNKVVAIVCPETALGGLTTSGLGWTDSKNGAAIGGIAREFYSNIYEYYNTDSTTIWKHQTRKEYIKLNIGAQPGRAIDEDAKVQWTFEPSAAQHVFDKMISDEQIEVYRDQRLNREGGGVNKNGSKITQICTLSDRCFPAQQFIDASYEGDLMAAASIQYQVGRDSQTKYGESLAGISLDRRDNYANIDPYIKPGNSDSGLIHGLEKEITGPTPGSWEGSSDFIRLQSFNYRLCLTKLSSNSIPFEKPDNYNVSDYELLLRLYEANLTSGFTTQRMPNLKTDSNSKGPMSFDFVGGNFDVESNMTYSEASYSQRQKIFRHHKDYQMGLLYTITHNERIPEKERMKWAQFGLAKDEFVDTDNWPKQLYIREARRMQGMRILTEQDVEESAGYIGDSIVGLGSYSLDSHVVRRIVQNGQIYDEGGFYARKTDPYPLPYQIIVPKREDATNFLNPVTLSASHVAFGGVRMEPTYMVLGQSAGIAAVLAIEQEADVQDVHRDSLTRLMHLYQQNIGS